VRGVADQETPAIRQASHDPPVHPKRGEPGDVSGPAPPAEPHLDPGNDVLGGYRFYLLFQLLETDPTPAWKRREQQQTIVTANQGALVSRERRLHRDISGEEMTLVSRAGEQLTHRVARDAVRPTRTNDNAWVNRLNLAVRVRELDQNTVRIRLHFRRRDPTLDRTAQRCEMGLENPLGLVLRQAAMELTPAIDTLESRGTKLGHTRAVYPVSPDVLGRLQERRQQADRVQDLECARLDRRGASLAVRLNLPLDKPYAHSVTGQFAGGEQSGRACPDN
jgi:hypothetical protein